jgi:hypothetical protein
MVKRTGEEISTKDKSCAIPNKGSILTTRIVDKCVDNVGIRYCSAKPTKYLSQIDNKIKNF